MVFLNAPTKRHRLAEWIQKQDPYICCLQETHFRPRDTYRLKVKGRKKIFHANGNQKKAGVAILVSDKKDIKIKTVTRDKEGPCWWKSLFLKFYYKFLGEEWIDHSCASTGSAG